MVILSTNIHNTVKNVQKKISALMTKAENKLMAIYLLLMQWFIKTGGNIM